MFELLRAALALLGTALAGWIDFKTSDIPDKIVAAMLVLAFAFHGAEFFLTGNSANLQSAFLYSIIFAIFGALMYFGRAWGGGDGALLTAVVALIPSTGSSVPFPIIYFASVFAVGLVYSTAYLLWKIWENPKVRLELAQNLKGNSFLSASTFLSAIFFLAAALTANIFVLPFALGFAFPLMDKLQKLSQKIFLKRISAKKLKENDMLGEDLPKLGIKKMIRGLTKDEAALIKKKINFITIADGVHFGPVFFFALMLSLLAQNYFFL